MTFTAPSSNAKSFTCPHGGVMARQPKWGVYLDHPGTNVPEQNIENAQARFSKCENCGRHCIWLKDALVYPDRSAAPRPNADMPEDVRVDYEDAARILHKSPRGAAALLRLAVQKLMVHLGQSGKNINDDIGALVARGLPVQVQQALDIVRVTGNNAVHPGQIDTQDVGIAEQLFPLVNVIVEYQISLPSRISEMYAALPKGARNAIAKRDVAD